jgi:hypothetical protein
MMMIDRARLRAIKGYSDTPDPPQDIVFGKDHLDVGARPLVAVALGN